MTITVGPEVEALIEELMATGRYASVTDLLEQALHALQELIHEEESI